MPNDGDSGGVREEDACRCRCVRLHRGIASGAETRVGPLSATQLNAWDRVAVWSFRLERKWQEMADVHL